MLNFLGRGSAFNPIFGNTSAFFKKGSTMFMIDCGENIYSRMVEWNVLEGVENIVIAITHTHPDHVGSLGTLIFHGYFEMGEMFKPSVTVIAHPAIDIVKTLKSTGVNREMYNLIEILGPTNISVKNINMKIDPILVPHVQELCSFGFLIRYNGENIYYSGDSNDIPDEILEKFKSGKIKYFYQDATGKDYKNNAHLSLRKLKELIPAELRHKVFCMHTDKNFPYAEMYESGFKIVKTIMDNGGDKDYSW